MNSIDVEIRKQETWGPQPAVTGGNPPSHHPPPHPSLRGWHGEKPASPVPRTSRWVFLETLLPKEQGLNMSREYLSSPLVGHSSKKRALIWHPGMGEAVTIQAGNSTAFYSPTFPYPKALKRPTWQARQWRIGPRDSNILLPIPSS